MVSEAEERRLKFLEAKKAAGGSARDLMKQVEARPYVVYFDDAGNILCVTKEYFLYFKLIIIILIIIINL